MRHATADEKAGETKRRAGKQVELVLRFQQIGRQAPLRTGGVATSVRTATRFCNFHSRLHLTENRCVNCDRGGSGRVSLHRNPPPPPSHPLLPQNPQRARRYLKTMTL